MLFLWLPQKSLHVLTIKPQAFFSRFSAILFKCSVLELLQARRDISKAGRLCHSRVETQMTLQCLGFLVIRYVVHLELQNLSTFTIPGNAMLFFRSSMGSVR